MRKIAVVVCLLTLALAACGRNDSPTIDAVPEPTTINVEAAETDGGGYRFGVDATATVDSLAKIVLKNAGAESHNATLLRVADGKTLDDLNAFFAATSPPAGPPPFSVGGGATEVGGGDSVSVTQALPAGNYAFFCFIPGPDGTPHFAKGMVAPITITGNSTTSLPLPDGENATMSEYKYDLPSLKAGTTTLRVRNSGAQDHEMAIGRVADGKTAQDAQAWLTAPQGPPPFAPVGGPVAGSNGGSNSFRLTLRKGTYVFYCNIPDVADQRSHLVHGMFQGVTIT